MSEGMSHSATTSDTAKLMASTAAKAARLSCHCSGKNQMTTRAASVVSVEASSAGKTARSRYCCRWCIITMLLSMMMPNDTVMPARAYRCSCTPKSQ